MAVIYIYIYIGADHAASHHKYKYGSNIDYIYIYIGADHAASHIGKATAITTK